MKSIIVKVEHTKARGEALRRLGFESELRGGDPLRSTERKPGGRRTQKVTKVWRADGRDMTTSDIRAARAALKA
jgi:hypothetical protein